MNEIVLSYCEKYGIYQPYKAKGNILTYYSYFGKEGIYKVVVNVKKETQKRKNLRYRNIPKFLKTDKGVLYNYFVG